MKGLSTLILAIIVTAWGCQLHATDGFKRKDVERGRYLVKITGCNDCHTPQYGLKGGDVPESDWLIGDLVGWKGPWGTTYPTNIRAKVTAMTEKDFIHYAKAIRTRPPMPWYSLTAMSDADLKALYRFIKHLGPSSNQVPPGLPPGQTPQGPYMDLTVQAH